MAIDKKPDPEQHLINQFDERFRNYVVGAREFKYIAAALRMRVDVDKAIRSFLKIEIIKILSSKPNWNSILKIDFERYSNSKKIDEHDFNFIGESKFEKFIYESYIGKMISGDYRNSLPDGRYYILAPRLGLIEIFDDFNFSTKDKIIFLYDAWDIAPHTKQMRLKELKAHVFESLQLSRRCDWFNNKAGALSAAYDHLRNLDRDCGGFLDSDDLKIYFYKNFWSNQEKIELIIKKIQMLFNNRKSRANKENKQVNFSLSERSIRNIEKLSKRYGENKSKIVDLVFCDDELIRKIDASLLSKGSHRIGFKNN